tara:strand:- start:72 stop:245 length:174 start_codon:yes stop_codon:yes gene_type:complete
MEIINKEEFFNRNNEKYVKYVKLISTFIIGSLLMYLIIKLIELNETNFIENENVTIT